MFVLHFLNLHSLSVIKNPYKISAQDKVRTSSFRFSKRNKCGEKKYWENSSHVETIRLRRTSQLLKSALE